MQAYRCLRRSLSVACQDVRKPNADAGLRRDLLLVEQRAEGPASAHRKSAGMVTMHDVNVCPACRAGAPPRSLESRDLCAPGASMSLQMSHPGNALS